MRCFTPHRPAVSAGDVEKLLSLTPNAAEDGLENLAARGVAVKSGAGTNARYALRPEIADLLTAATHGQRFTDISRPLLEFTSTRGDERYYREIYRLTTAEGLSNTQVAQLVGLTGERIRQITNKHNARHGGTLLVTIHQTALIRGALYCAIGASAEKLLRASRDDTRERSAGTYVRLLQELDEYRGLMDIVGFEDPEIPHPVAIDLALSRLALTRALDIRLSFERNRLNSLAGRQRREANTNMDAIDRLLSAVDEANPR